jgi:hypothetical protein
MPFVNPKWWQHEDPIVFSELQVLSDNLPELISELTVVNRADSGPTSENNNKTGWYDTIRNQEFGGLVFVHTHRWLRYRSRGDTYSPVVVPFHAHLGEQTDLPITQGRIEEGVFVGELDGEWITINLDEEIPWMVPGLLYWVKGVDFAIEVDSL